MEGHSVNPWKARTLQGAGLLLQAGAAMLLIIAGDEGELAAALLGVASGVGGLLLWGAGARESGQELRGQADTAEQLAQMEQQLFALQDDVAFLLDAREAPRDEFTPIPDDRERGVPRLPRGYRGDRH
jgi:hypothetical protein